MICGTGFAVSTDVKFTGDKSELTGYGWNSRLSKSGDGAALRGGAGSWWPGPSSHCTAGFFLSFCARGERPPDCYIVDGTDLGANVLSGGDDDNWLGDRVLSTVLGRSAWRTFCQSSCQKTETETGGSNLREVGSLDGSGPFHTATSDTVQSLCALGGSLQGTLSTVFGGRPGRAQYTVFSLGNSGSAVWRMGEASDGGKPPYGRSGSLFDHGIDGCSLFHLESIEETESAGSDMKESLTRIGALIALLSGLGCGAVKEKTVITTPVAYAQAKTATPQELVTLVNERYAKIRSVTVRRCEVEFTGGSIDDGYLEKYRKANGLFIAQNPDSIFVNILNPLTNSTVVVMASRDEQFQIWIPSKNTFVTGMTNVKPKEDNPLYNVRPSHIMEGILVEPIPLSDPRYRYFAVEDEDGQFRYYVLGVFELKEKSSDSNLLRRLWIERSTMQVKKQQYYDGAEVVSTITYGDVVDLEGMQVGTRIKIERPRDRYAIAFQMEPDNIKLDSELKPDAFNISQPAGAEVIVVAQEDGE